MHRRIAALCVGCALVLPSPTQNAIANGDTRTLDLYHAHTRESLRITYKRDGSFDRDALSKLNWFLRDWRNDEPISMAPDLFDIIWYSYRESGASETIKVVSAYRSPGTNAMLRRRSRAVAKNSQHMRGNAMDFHIPGMSMAKVREVAMRLQRGGVGYYPTAGSPFVHLDVGTVRSWPRMTRDQLERMFPDGKTVHLPADGVPLANYQAALAEVQARGGSALDYNTVTSNSGKSLWAMLFGADDDEDSRTPSERRNPGRRERGRGVPEQVAAYAPSNADNVMSPGVTAYASRASSVDLVPRSPAIAEPSPPRAELVAPKTSASLAEPAPIQIASLPVPPIRPRGAAFDQMSAASDPLPPIRPTHLMRDAFAQAAPDAAPVEAAAVPPKTEAPPVQVAVNAPLPPLRPVLTPARLPNAESKAEVVLPAIVNPAAINPVAPQAQAYASIAAPLPPQRPAAAQRPDASQRQILPVVASMPSPAPNGAVAPAVPPLPRTLSAARMDRTKAETAHRVPDPPVAREVASQVLASRFSKIKAAPESGFAGQFIRPMGMSFTRSGE